MGSRANPNDDPMAGSEEAEEAMLDPADAAEEVPVDDEDHPMDSDPDDEEEEQIEQEILLQNDSIAHFSHHTDSLFAIAAHPLNPSIIATGSGDDTAYIFSVASASSPLLPRSYESNPSQTQERESIPPLAHLKGHTDSVACLTFTLPNGDFLVTGGLDGQIRVYATPALSTLSSPPSSTTSPPSWPLIASATETKEISWLIPSPHPSHPNTFALGAPDGSVWVYTIDPTSSPAAPLQVLQAYYIHSAPTTAGSWSPSGSLLASVAEDSTLHVYDPFGDAALAGVSSTGQALLSLGPEDQRFIVDGGLYSLAFSPSGSLLAVGGAGGLIRVVGMPLLNSTAAASASETKGQKGAGARSKAQGGKQAASSAGGGGQVGQILASLQVQSDGVETLAFAGPGSGLQLLAAGSVDGSVALFDAQRNWAVRRVISKAHDGEAVVSVLFDKSEGGTPWVLTSCGLDGVVRRWDARGGGTAAAAAAGQQVTAGAGGEQGLVGEWKGHRGGGEGGGVMGFVVGGGKVVTAGDDEVALVFDVGG